MSGKIAVGRFGSPFGIKGWIKVISYTDPIEQILQYVPWYLDKDPKKVLKNVKGQLHGKQLIVHLNDCHDRDQAKAYTNLEIYINREQLPSLSEEEYYWHDLLGLEVINQQNILFGKIKNIFATGSNDVLVVEDENGKERYLPYIEGVIIKVDLQKKQLSVDWDADF